MCVSTRPYRRLIFNVSRNIVLQYPGIRFIERVLPRVFLYTSITSLVTRYVSHLTIDRLPKNRTFLLLALDLVAADSRRRTIRSFGRPWEFRNRRAKPPIFPFPFLVSESTIRVLSFSTLFFAVFLCSK